MIGMGALFHSTADVLVYEVGPRDGLQNESVFIKTEDKCELVETLSASGLSKVEVTSFVNPRWIPALADASRLLEMLQRQQGTRYGALVPNMKGMERALEFRPDEVAIFMSASETHNKKNINKSHEETFQAFEKVVAKAREEELPVRAYLSTVWGCPYEGDVSLAKTLSLIDKLNQLGCYEISLGDTIGVGDPAQTRRIISEVKAVNGLSNIAMHMHDTRGTALANCLVGLELGVATFDSSIGGLGGCPYAPGASGNLATEDLVYMLERMGVKTGIDLKALVRAGLLAQRLLNRKLPGRALAALAHTYGLVEE